MAATACPPEHELRRVLSWRAKGREAEPGDDELGEEELRGIGLAELVELFRADKNNDPCMLDFYPVSARQAAQLQPSVTHVMDFGAHDYYVASYLRSSE